MRRSTAAPFTCTIWISIDALDDILRELMADTTCTLEHVLCPERACATYPFCDKIHSSPRYRAVFLDESVT